MGLDTGHRHTGQNSRRFRALRFYNGQRPHTSLGSQHEGGPTGPRLNAHLVRHRKTGVVCHPIDIAENRVLDIAFQGSYRNEVGSGSVHGRRQELAL